MVAAAPDFRDGQVCAVCGAELPSHAADCPYRRHVQDSFDAMAGVAAPLLAGFSVATIGVVISAAASFRWPGWTLLLLTAAALALIMAVQGGFWTRYYRPETTESYEYSGNLPSLDSYRRWLRATRSFYDIGLVLLLAAVAVALYPKGTDVERVPRQIAAGLAGASAVVELAWAFMVRQRRTPF